MVQVVFQELSTCQVARSLAFHFCSTSEMASATWRSSDWSNKLIGVIVKQPEKQEQKTESLLGRLRCDGATSSHDECYRR